MSEIGVKLGNQLLEREQSLALPRFIVKDLV